MLEGVEEDAVLLPCAAEADEVLAEKPFRRLLGFVEGGDVRLRQLRAELDQLVQRALIEAQAARRRMYVGDRFFIWLQKLLTSRSLTTVADA